MEKGNKKGDVDDYSVMEKDIYIEKVILFQQRDCCSKTHINVPMCKKFLTRIVAAMNKGDIFNEEESTEIFFALTKLFTSQDLTLRRLCDKISSFRCSSLRCLSRLMTPQIAPSIERFFKQTLVDSTMTVQIASLICCLKLPQDIVQKYLTETSSCVDSPNALVQYHATRLFFFIKQQDPHALLRFITTKAPSITSSFAQMELIRKALSLYMQNPTKNEAMVNYIVNVTQGSTDMIVIESLRALMKANHTKGLSKLVPRLQKLLSSTSTVTKFAAVRIVSELATKSPEVIAILRNDIESLLKDSNRAIVTLATSAALRISTEKNIEKLLKKIGKFIQGLPDGFRIQVLDTIEQTAEKYPNKHEFLMKFLGNMLQVKGVIFENAVITVMVHIAEISISLREKMLHVLGDFIEDCQYSQVIERVIGIFGEVGPLCKERVSLLRTIFNRIVLENANVRAAGVSALFNFANNNENIEDVKVLMEKCKNDENDEVKNRANFYCKVLEEKIVKEVNENVIDEFPVDNMEEALDKYLNEGKFDEEFDISTVSKETKIEAQKREEEEVVSRNESELESRNNELFGELGKVNKTCNEILVSGIDTEYQVSVTKVVYEKHLVLKCNVKNTLPDYQLENVEIIPGTMKNYEVFKSVKVPRIAPLGEECVVLILLIKSAGAESISLKMNYQLREYNSISQELAQDTSDEEYPLDQIAINASDYIGEYRVPDWNTEWNKIVAQNEKKVVIKYQNVESIKEAVDRIKTHFGLGVIDKSDIVTPEEKKHILFLAGIMKGNVVLIRVRLMIDKTGQIPLEVCIRSPDAELATSLHASL
ncbi:coatomer subunit gamma-2, putative [Entamoeba invadens IP1]|uniref:Coatomer subunit gamma n=1 Tax=Entamoeba invadens IP1 TaxID=370355 RepID=A0A0A1U5H2_ENTIV|nr:coatomer subunit gamma-2, putative [Entamoeba invadens IP1]ELP89477.1 coatomer subunit gamma-2, putative [Entamoeba invadens IP1]|eukprot:XP_004256248.1 coatomer subunit gamma-2, putative [Entamoeba invadens IP1]